MTTPQNWGEDAWARQETARERLKRAITAPVVAAGAVLLVVVLISIFAVITVPRDPVAATLTSPAPVDHESVAESEVALSPDMPPETLVVHVVGAVVKPGVVELPAGARVAEAIEAAGGATLEALLIHVNLARPVSDGEQIIVPDESLLAEASSLLPERGWSESGGGLVNVNTASAGELETLPGIGPALSNRILQWRETQGGFSATEQLLEVSGVGPKVFAQLQDLVTVG